MNKDIIEGFWKELKGNIKEKWGSFTHNNVLKMKGFYEAYYGGLQKEAGYEREKQQWKTVPKIPSRRGRERILRKAERRLESSKIYLLK